MIQEAAQKPDESSAGDGAREGHAGDQSGDNIGGHVLLEVHGRLLRAVEDMFLGVLRCGLLASKHGRQGDVAFLASVYDGLGEVGAENRDQS